MEYPRRFINRVVKELPNSKTLHECLYVGNVIHVGEMLFTERSLNLTPHEIVNLFKKGKGEEVLGRAERAVRYDRIYRAWKEHVKDEFPDPEAYFRRNCSKK